MRNRMPAERRDVLAQLEREMCSCCRPVARRLFADVAGPRAVYRWAVLPSHRALALTLLNTGMSRSEARGVLMIRLQVSRRTAYRLISDALQARAGQAMRAEHDGLRQIALALDDERD